MATHLFCWLFCALHIFVGISAQSSLQNFWSSIEVFEKLAEGKSAECRNHTKVLLQSLRNATFWAVQMLDASANTPSGILEGNIYNLGDFDECLSVDNGQIQGQYCLASLNVDGPRLENLRGRPVHDAQLTPYPFSNAWHHIQNRGERWRAPRDSVKLAICVPKTCSNSDVQRAMHAAFAPRVALLNGTLHVEVPQRLCSTHEPFEISSLDIAFFAVVGVLLVVVVTASIYEHVLKSRREKRDEKAIQSLGLQIFLCFAAGKNFSGLSNMEKESDTDLNFLFGIRLFSILTVIACHKVGFTTAGPVKNPNFQEQSFGKLQYMPVLHGDLVVDTFFFLAGFLLTVGLLKALRRPIAGMKVSVWPLYLFRYLRLTPAYMLTILFYVSILPKMGSGPLWKVTVVPESEYCRENWWANALYVNNYVRVERSCIEQGWYMPCDMHMFVVCAPLVLLVHRRPKVGLPLLGALTFASVIAPLLTIWILDTDAMLLFFLDFLRGSRVHPYFSSLYVKSHVRASPYFIGVIIGLIYMSKRQARLAKAKSLPLLLIGFALALATSLSAALFYHTEGAVATSPAARAFYGAFHRPMWTLAMGLIVLAIARGRLTFMRKILSWKPLIPLSKLSYGAFLIHVIILWYSAGTAREATYNNTFLVILKTMGDTTVTFGVALLLYLAVEAPIRDMTKLALSSRIKMQMDENKKLPMEELNSSSDVASNGVSSSMDSGVCTPSADLNFKHLSNVAV
ncbi:nose resistant to fluoxetine protein 6-like [Neocloeon triangulifer]|uniref:nose resistant to fluoxetine protein 6-like n=1 Tax=Neocloeon triangulifer TaxID=2078957 RepID=UPI00286F5DD9|nr:nose resistant to fluoxetine protein 6-like [Neocloeon triangulifer]